MTEARRCPTCGTELPNDAPQGLCPRCLLQRGLDPTGGAGAAEEGAGTASHSAFTAPAPAELAGRFPQLEILELLGQGGMGAVYKARQPALDRLVALKILPPEVGRDPAFAERFAREARALARLNHPHIVTIHDFGQADGLYYLLMEYVDGVNLRQLLRAGQLRPAEALKIVPQVCEALQFAHDEGVVHRDIKPENILLDRKGRVKIADFGLAKLLGRKPADFTLTAAEQIMGTPHYMAPEQIERPLAVDHRADIYSLGVVFYEMLTGELPLGRFAPPSQKVQVDVRLDEVVLRALEREPERRYQHASEVKVNVETITGTPPPSGAGALAVGETADDELEKAILKLLPDKKFEAIREYQDRTGVGFWEAREALEAIARKHGLGILFPRRNLAIGVAVCGIIVAFMAWVMWGVSPVLTYPLLLVLCLPTAVRAWRLRGTPEGRREALFAGSIFLLIVGIPLIDFVHDPEPVLNRLYALTGAVPGRHDVLFVRTLVGVGLLGVVIWWLRLLRKPQAKPRGQADMVSPPPRSPAESPTSSPPGEPSGQTVGGQREPALRAEGAQPAAPGTGPQAVPDRVLLRRVTILTVVSVLLWNLALITLDLGYLARADWYSRKELPYDYLQWASMWFFSLSLACGAWWYYLLAKEPGTPRSFQDFVKVWQSYEPRVRPAWKPLAAWFGLWFAASVAAVVSVAWDYEVPFIVVMHAGLLLTPFVLMILAWRVLKRPGTGE